MKKINEDETVAEPATEPAPNAYQMVSLIGNVVDQKPSEFATTFDQLMKDRITQKIADRKVEMARDAFSVARLLMAMNPRNDEPEEEPEVQEPDENGEPVEEPEEEDEPIDDTEEEQPPPELAQAEDMSNQLMNCQKSY